MARELRSTVDESGVGWRCAQAFLARYGYVHHQHDGYAQFLYGNLPEIVRENSDIHIEYTHADGALYKHHVSFEQLTLHQPRDDDGSPILPYDARMRRLTYNVDATIRARHTIDRVVDGATTRTQNILHPPALFFRIPCMVRSRACWTHERRARQECPMDVGGYFIIAGQEKVLMSQLKLAGNRIFVFPFRSDHRYPYVAEIRSTWHSKWRSTSTIKAQMRAGTHSVTVTLPFVVRGATSVQIGLMHVWRAVEHVSGLEPMTRDAVAAACTDTPESRRALRADLVDVGGEEAARWIGESGSRPADTREAYTRHILHNEFFPHIVVVGGSASDTARARLLFLGSMVRRLVAVQSGRVPADDRDDNANKQCVAVGPLLAILFRQLFRNHLKTVKNSMQRVITNHRHVTVPDYLAARRIETGLLYHFTSGNWSTQRAAAANGVCQPVNRMSLASMVSHLRRVSIPLNRDGKQAQVRQLHHTDWRIFCPAETPEGQAVGLVRNLSICAYISGDLDTGSVTRAVRRVLRAAGVAWTAVDAAAVEPGLVPLTINGSPQMVLACDPGEAVGILRRARRTGGLPGDASISWTPFDGVAVFTDRGRMCSPVFVVENLDRLAGVLRDCGPRDLWAGLVAAGVVEMIDKREERAAKVAPSLSALRRGGGGDGVVAYTHCEIDPVLVLGVTTNTIPFSNFNQAPRNMYSTSMSKAAIGWGGLGQAYRHDARAFLLQYPMRPLVATRVGMDVINWDLPTGTCCVVAICMHDGMNQEDSIVVNRAAIQRGLARCFSYSTHRATLKRGATDVETFECPPEGCLGRRADANYDKVDPSDGIVPVGVRVEPNDVIIARTLRRLQSRGGVVEWVRDRSVVVPKSGGGVVDRVDVTVGRDGATTCAVKIRTQRIPEVGDKFASRAGQKGTIGAIVAPEDLGFTQSGMQPDLIINPHCIPSRMTIGMIMEMLCGKLAAVEGRVFDGTPFQETFQVDAVRDALKRAGWSGYGEEVLYSGTTGKRMGRVFMGPCDYNRLSHLVDMKIHSRGGYGPVSAMTRQPKEGRAREGGPRFGEMEKDCCTAHGAAEFLRDKFSSDRTSAFVCRSCQHLCDPPPPPRGGKAPDRAYCRVCKSHSTAARVEMPYAFILLMHELAASGIDMRPVVEPVE